MNASVGLVDSPLPLARKSRHSQFFVPLAGSERRVSLSFLPRENTRKSFPIPRPEISLCRAMRWRYLTRNRGGLHFGWDATRGLQMPVRREFILYPKRLIHIERVECPSFNLFIFCNRAEYEKRMRIAITKSFPLNVIRTHVQVYYRLHFTKSQSLRRIIVEICKISVLIYRKKLYILKSKRLL